MRIFSMEKQVISFDGTSITMEDIIGEFYRLLFGEVSRLFHQPIFFVPFQRSHFSLKIKTNSLPRFSFLM